MFGVVFIGKAFILCYFLSWSSQQIWWVCVGNRLLQFGKLRCLSLLQPLCEVFLKVSKHCLILFATSNDSHVSKRFWCTSDWCISSSQSTFFATRDTHVIFSLAEIKESKPARSTGCFDDSVSSPSFFLSLVSHLHFYHCEPTCTIYFAERCLAIVWHRFLKVVQVLVPRFLLEN